MSTERDPRVDPRPGDMLATRHRVRTVTKVLNVSGVVDVKFTTDKGSDDASYLVSWRRWARNAEVLTRGEP